MRHGNVYPRDRIDAALANFFRPSNLAAMRQIGLRLVADSMARTRKVQHPPEDVMVAISGGPSSEDLIRRGARLARRVGGTCMVVHVLAKGTSPDLDRWRDLAAQVGCSFAVLGGRDVARALVEAATTSGAEHVVVGEAVRASRVPLLTGLRPTLVDRLIDALPNSDIHVIARVAG